MEKNEILEYIKDIAIQKLISREEIISAYEQGLGLTEKKEENKNATITEVLCYIGGAIVFLGVSIFVWQNWTTMNVFTKIMATLGVSIMAYIVGILFIYRKKFETIGSSFYLISALVMPIGLYTFFKNIGFDTGINSTQSLISGILLGVFLLSYFIFRKDIFTLFSILFGTWFYFNFTSYIFSNTSYSELWKFHEYRILIAGIIYIILGYMFSKSNKSSLRGFLYGFGIMAFLGSALSLGDWSPKQNYFWEMVYPVLILTTLILSVYLKSKSFLTFGSFFLVCYISKITSEYFSQSLGWALSLVIIGLMLIGVGYLAFSLKSKYFISA